MPTPNPFEPPSESADATLQRLRRGPLPRLYSPNQVALAALIGSPLAASWLMAANFGLLGRGWERRVSWFVGAAATLLVFVVLALASDEQPFLLAVVPVAYALGARELTRFLQGAEIERVRAAGGIAESWWLVLGFGVVCFFVSLILVALVGAVAVLFLIEPA